MNVAVGPSSWFWAHDIEDAAQLNDLAVPGMQLQRLANYRRGHDLARRFVALYHSVPNGASRQALIDARAGEAESCGPYAAGVTADGDSPLENPRFTVVLDVEPSPGRRLHTGLDVAGIQAICARGDRIVDFATYRPDGDVQRFAVITEPHGQPLTFLPDVRPGALRRELRARRIRPLRLRPYVGLRGPAVAVLAGAGDAIARADITGDALSGFLERRRAWPVDIDALGGPDGVRFTVVAVR